MAATSNLALENGKAVEKMKRWLKMGDEILDKAKLERKLEEWQHRLGLCALGITPIPMPSFDGCQLLTGRNERHWEIKACNERTVLHELLHLLFYERHREGVIFALTNCLLRLKYQGK